MASLKKIETEESLGGSFWYVFLMPSQPYNYSLFLWINLRNGLFKNLILNLLTAEKKKKNNLGSLLFKLYPPRCSGI